MGLLWSIIFGAIVGWIASKVMDTKSGMIRNIIVGMIGASIGNAGARMLGFIAYTTMSRLLVAVVGACIFIFIGRIIFGK